MTQMYRTLMICNTWPLKLLSGKGGHYQWVQKDLTLLGYNVLQEYWLLSGEPELAGLSVYEPFGGIGMTSVLIQKLLSPSNLHIGEIDQDCLRQLEFISKDFPNTTVSFGDARVELLKRKADVYLLDWPSGYTSYQYGKWQKQWEAVYGNSPEAVTWYDTSARYLHLQKERYADFFGSPCNTPEEYAMAVSWFIWRRHGYSITKVAYEPQARRAYFMAKAKPVGQILFHYVPKGAVGVELKNGCEVGE